MTRLSWSRIFAIARKEVAHIIRDRFTTALAIGLPIIMILIFGTAFDFNLDHIPLAVQDNDKTQSSRQFIDSFSSSSHFKIIYVDSSSSASKALDSGKAMASLIIPIGFERDLGGGEGSVQVLVDGSDSSSAASILSYLPELRRLAQERLIGHAPPEPIKLKTRFLFNPELNTQWFIVPGLGVAIMAILSILLTSLTIAREWETGSMELLLSTPVRPIEIIFGKLLPYLVLGLGGVTFVYAAARLAFGVPFRGSHALYLLGCVLFITTCMAQGLLISVITRSQQLAMQAAMISGLLPSMFLSGFIYPIEHMPKFFQYLTAILAPRWFMLISHNLYLKGSGLAGLAQAFMALSMICLIVVGLAALNFKKDVEP